MATCVRKQLQTGASRCSLSIHVLPEAVRLLNIKDGARCSSVESRVGSTHLELMIERGPVSCTATRLTLAAEESPKLIVTKDPNCGWCRGWTDHIRKAGFPVKIIETGELNQVKTRLGVPRHLAACH